MSTKRKVGRPAIRHTEECREAIVSLARYWKRINREFSVNTLADSVFGYHGGQTPAIIQDALRSTDIKCKSRNVPARRPEPVCTNFVVTTHTHS